MKNSEIITKLFRSIVFAILLLAAPKIMAQYNNPGGSYTGSWKDLNNNEGKISLKIYPVYQDTYQGHAIVTQNDNTHTSLLNLSGSQGYVQGYMSSSVYNDTTNLSVFNCQLTFSGKLGFENDKAIIKGEAVPQGCHQHNLIYLDLVRQQE
ncbi:MAG: hypothetical protein ACR2MX_14520 [Cyclobacteriaceae bacterium]